MITKKEPVILSIRKIEKVKIVYFGNKLFATSKILGFSSNLLYGIFFFNYETIMEVVIYFNKRINIINNFEIYNIHFLEAKRWLTSDLDS